MPRTARALQGGWCYHVINRANNRATLFQGPGDYRAFLDLIAEAQRQRELALLAACVMPNHFHFVVRPDADLDVSRWMHWLLTTHVRRFHRRHDSTGRVWQGRFKAFPIEQDEHLVTVMRYVERNALRAGLVARAENWPWGSLAWRAEGSGPVALAPSPTPLPRNWVRYVNAPQTPAELTAIRTCAQRETPFGSEEWNDSALEVLGIKKPCGRRGRPPRAKGPLSQLERPS